MKQVCERELGENVRTSLVWLQRERCNVSGTSKAQRLKCQYVSPIKLFFTKLVLQRRWRVTKFIHPKDTKGQIEGQFCIFKGLIWWGKIRGLLWQQLNIWRTDRGHVLIDNP
jgi:hypothetical protein